MIFSVADFQSELVTLSKVVGSSSTNMFSVKFESFNVVGSLGFVFEISMV